ncbi:MAG: hypothetical protein Q4E17_06500 [Synergistes sp.]|nr:hypothetical protein [Synergistes sp.]
MSNNIFYDEHHKYRLDCSKADWATDEIHSIYHSENILLLSDVDFAFSKGDTLYLVEYKNACVNEHARKSGFNPSTEDMVRKIAYKYYDSYFYLLCIRKATKLHIKYVYIVEYPNSDSASRKALRNKITESLPFRLQKKLAGSELISDFDVVSVDEWNKLYHQYPFTRCK